MTTNRKPLISVLMLTYNHAPYISEAIESVLNQETDYILELIICDDASTDGTQDIARRYAEKDSRVVLSLQPTNTKFGKNFVDGCSLIQGKYVAFCEGDDYWTDSGKLQKQVSFLEGHPDFSISAHKVQMLIMGEQQPSSQKQFIYKDCSADDQRIRDGIFYADEAIANYYFQTGSLVLRWRFTKGLPDWFRQRMMFDHFMFMLHAVEGKIKYFDEAMSVWRRHGGGYTWLQTQDKGLFFQKEGDDWIRMYQHMDDFFSRRFTWQIRERILLALRSIAANCITTGNIDQLRDLVEKYRPHFNWVIKDSVLLDALRMACPEHPEFSPPWESAPREEKPAEKETPQKTPPCTPGISQENASPCTPSSPSANASSGTSGESMNGVTGGCFELALEDIPPIRGSVWEAWTDGREYARFFNLRSALFRWLWQRGVSTLWLPTYCPPILESNRLQCQFTRKFYSVGNRLEPTPDFLAEVRPGEAVLTISYLGKPLPDAFCAALAARTDILWVEDRAQCLVPGRESAAHAVIYSPRKLFGVPDGGLLVGKGARDLESWCLAPALSTLSERYSLLAERFERPDLMDNTHNLRWSKHDMEHQLSRSRMSRTTEAILRRVPLDAVARRRQDNWECLYQALGDLCLWRIERPDFAPYAFPLLTPENFPTEILHTLLARHNVLCHRMWYPLALSKNLYPLEESLAKRLLLLPCDQRHQRKDMLRMANLVRQILENPQLSDNTGSGFNVI